MKNGIKTLFIVSFLLIAAALVANANYGNEGFGMGTFHENIEESSSSKTDVMENIVENGTLQDLENFRTENSGFGGPRWVNDEESFNEWKEHHELMEGYMGESNSKFGNGRRGRAGEGGCPMGRSYN